MATTTDFKESLRDQLLLERMGQNVEFKNSKEAIYSLFPKELNIAEIGPVNKVKNVKVYTKKILGPTRVLLRGKGY